MYEEGHYLALLNPEGSFYVCQTTQDIPFKSKKKFKIRWFEEIGSNTFKKQDRFDLITPDTIIDEILLTKINISKFVLEESERLRILKKLNVGNSDTLNNESIPRKENPHGILQPMENINHDVLSDGGKTSRENKMLCSESETCNLSSNNNIVCNKKSLKIQTKRKNKNCSKRFCVESDTSNYSSDDDYDACSQTTLGIKSKNTKPLKKLKKNCTSDEDDSVNVNDSLFNKQTGKRLYNKRHACYFCNKIINKMSRHLELVHSNEMEVAKILTLPKGSRERKIEFAKITRIGDYYHNCEVLNLKRGDLILIRRPTENESRTADYSHYGPCPHCLGFILRKHLWLHIKKNCPETKEEDNTHSNNKTVGIESQAMLSYVSSSNLPENFVRNIIDPMRFGPVGTVCREDTLILKFGIFQFEKYSTTQSELIRQSMRQIARLLIEVRKISNIKTVSECIKPENFDLIVEAVKILCVKEEVDSERPTLKCPSLALKLGHHLRKCASIERGTALRSGDLVKDGSIQSFLHLMGLEWAQRVSSIALSTLKRKRYNLTELLPLTSDLIKINKYLADVIAKSTEDLEGDLCTKDAWFKLADATLCRIILFNKRRSGEASKIKIKDFYHKPDWSSETTEELKNTLSSVEIQLSNRLTLINVKGKKERKVALILTEEVKKSINILMKYRNRIMAVLPENIYLFPCASSKNHTRGDRCIRKMCEEADLQKPELVTSTKLRKYMATVVQLFDLTETETDWLARHLGHDIRVHRNFYRLQESAVELTKISRLLMVVDNGNAKEYSGRPLSDIGMAELPPLSESEESSSEDCVPVDKSNNDKNKRKQTTSIQTSAEPGLSKRLTKKSVTKRLWSTDDRKLVLKYFRNSIKTGDTPGKQECEAFLASNPLDRNWKDVKWCVYNTITRTRKNISKI